MAKKKIQRHTDKSLVAWLCRTQGIGINLAKDVVEKLDAKIRTDCEAMIDAGKPVNEIFAAMKPAPEAEPEPKKSDKKQKPPKDDPPKTE